MIEDEKIVELFFRRSELAIRELDNKYGKVCHKLSYNIVNNRQDAEECVNDAYLGAWNAIPPEKPDPLLTYLCKIVRNISLKMYYRKKAAKRSSTYTIAMEEIEACIAAPSTVETEFEARELARVIESFLDTLTAENRVIFMRRYWFSDSCKDGATAVHWECDGGTEFDMTDGSKEGVGTEITLFLNEDCLEFANEYRAREVIEKYCSFMPTPIFLEKENAETEYETIPADEVTEKDTVVENIVEEAKYEEKENEDGTKEQVEVSPRMEKAKIVKRPVALNDTNPLWAKHPNECTDEEYIAFYRKVFQDYKEPLFWIHLNMDYPFNLKGILYFPKINMEYESIEGVIKLYNNQVFIADNIKEVIPEFLMLLDRKSTRLNSSHRHTSRMPSSA